jgi:uncharacterized membrane protein
VKSRLQFRQLKNRADFPQGVYKRQNHVSLNANFVLLAHGRGGIVTLYIILRLVHILAGVFWAGANFVMAGFVNPSVKASAPESGKFMQHLAQKSGFPRFAEVTGWLTVLAGLGLFWLVSDGFSASWFSTRRGIVLTIGGLMAIAALVIAYALQKPAARRLAQLGQEIQASQGPPTPQQLAEIQAQQNKLAQGARWTAILLTISVIGMALSR